MVLYLTYNDQPSGVYWSQVTDVVEHLNSLGGPKVKLIALVSGRDFLSTRKKIKAHSPSAWVLPMVPTMKRWKLNTVILAWVCRLLKPSGLICRGPFATWMALRMRERGLTKKVCFDGRGAYAAEWEEYRIIDDDALIAQFRPLENEAVNASDFRISVSQALVEHWRERFGYVGEAHVVVPCTLGKDHLAPLVPEGVLQELATGMEPNELGNIQVVYSGSAAGWQSFGLLSDLANELLSQPKVSLLFLSPDDANIRSLMERHAGRVQRLWLKPDEVRYLLNLCNAGILHREDTITNRVASPTKFAEYLAAGLPVIISKHLGDFSALVKAHDLGVVVEEGRPLPELKQVEHSERERLRGFALEHFTKPAFQTQYKALLLAMTT